MGSRLKDQPYLSSIVEAEVASKILLLESIHPLAKAAFEAQGHEVTEVGSSMTSSELLSELKAYDVVGLRSKTQLTQEVIQGSSHLTAIGCFCIGTNQVHLHEAMVNGIPVFNAPYSNTRSVAELVVAEVISLSRGLFDVSMGAHHGQWTKSAKGRREVRGKTLGIIGYGHIGSQVSVLAEALGMKVCYYDIVTKLPLGNAEALGSLNELLAESDFVTLHVPETPETKNMMAASQLRAMKKGSFLINASRGSVVDIEDLKVSLEEGHVAGAAVDVFPKEPKSNNEEFESPLRGVNNVILTPHIGGSTEEAQANIGREVSQSLLNYLEQGSSRGAVQFPQVDVPVKKEGAQRLLSLHKNVPGVLTDVNSRISERGLNIQAQYLSTNPEVGYLVMDVEASAHAQTFYQEVKAQEYSVKTRLI